LVSIDDDSEAGIPGLTLSQFEVGDSIPDDAAVVFAFMRIAYPLVVVELIARARYKGLDLVREEDIASPSQMGSSEKVRKRWSQNGVWHGVGAHRRRRRTWAYKKIYPLSWEDDTTIPPRCAPLP